MARKLRRWWLGRTPEGRQKLAMEDLAAALVRLQNTLLAFHVAPMLRAAKAFEEFTAIMNETPEEER